MNWFREHHGVLNLWDCFYAVLLVAVVWDLGRPGYRCFISSGAGERTGCELDAFSEPSIAAAILKQEVERVFNTYVHQRDLELDTAFADRLVRGSRQPGAGLSPRDGPACEVAAARRAEGRTTTIQSLEHLRAEAEGLKCDLDCKLLAIHAETGLWPGFLDHYVRFVRESPDNPSVLTWARCALVQAQKSGRATEVVEALEQAARARSGLKTASGLRDFLALHDTKEPHSVQAANP